MEAEAQKLYLFWSRITIRTLSSCLIREDPIIFGGGSASTASPRNRRQLFLHSRANTIFANSIIMMMSMVSIIVVLWATINLIFATLIALIFSSIVMKNLKSAMSIITINAVNQLSWGKNNVSDIVTTLESLGWKPLAREAQIVESWDPCCEEVETERGNGGKFHPQGLKMVCIKQGKKGPNRPWNGPKGQKID